MPIDNVGEMWPRIIAAVTTPLGFFVLVVLVVEAGLIGLAATVGRGDHVYLLAVVGVLVLLIFVVALIAVFRPEALIGKRYEPITTALAESLGIDVYAVFDGYIEEINKEEAYSMLRDACVASSESKNDSCKVFNKTFVETIVSRSKILGKVSPRGHLVTPNES
ncbi:MAG: hypothetical protein ACU88J_13100 [Gammaproteobacteria bacterium]